MNLEDKIELYKTGKNYTKSDLQKFVIDYTNNKINDQLMTKFIKSIFDKPLSKESTVWLTEIMMNSGTVISLSDIPGIKVDKHSTGGIGDKVTLILAPIIASLGVCFAKMSGKSLGFTGGTLDKLESIDGYNIYLSEQEFKDNLKKHQIAVIGQTENIVPADKKIYALRDEQNLIASIPLIASSIMAKKIVMGADIFLIDVKVGNGAFMKTESEAKKLAKQMIYIGQKLGYEIKVEITSMETPLGYEIGNKNEVLETISFLKGKTIAKDLKKIIYSSAVIILMMAKLFNNKQDAITAIDETIANGGALLKFKEWIQSQGGNIKKLFSDHFWQPKYKWTKFAAREGYFNITSAVKFGKLAMKLGAGRKKKEDKIDFEAGISLHYKTGDFVKKGDKLFTLFSSQKINNEYQNYLNNSYEISDFKNIKNIILNQL